MSQTKQKYSVYQIKRCEDGVKCSSRMSSTDDINQAYQRVETIYKRIKKLRRHTQAYYGSCYRDDYLTGKCKGKFEVRENW